MRKVIALVSVISLLLLSLQAMAQTRLVVVNGIRLSDQQIRQLEYFNCIGIPNGWYWLNLQNGAWGYAGNWQVQGYFGDACRLPANSQAAQRRKSLSERGLLYSPGEILR
jgi:hypothetical protein